MGKVTFERPPLIEVSFGLFFSPLTAFRSSHYGLFWNRLRPDFTEAHDRAAVVVPGAQLVSTSDWFPLPRVWYVHKQQEQLLQLQPDRFYFNWRKNEGSEYPRYDNLEPMFFQHLEALRDFVQAEALGTLDVTGIELVYVNRIEPGEGWSGMPAVGEVFPDLTWPRDRVLAPPAGLAWHGLFELEHMRLDADIKTARQTKEEDSSRFLQFELRATSQKKLSPDDFRPWFREANDVIVSAFSTLTSKQMQKEQWKRAGA